MGIVSLALALAGCAASEPEERAFSLDTRSAQSYPAQYREELLVFLRSYLNDPTQVRGAMIAEPVERTFGGRTRYIVCVRYNARSSTGSYTGASDRMATYLNGRFDRLIENGREQCASAAYVPFPELEKLTR